MLLFRLSRFALCWIPALSVAGNAFAQSSASFPPATSAPPAAAPTTVPSAYPSPGPQALPPSAYSSPAGPDWYGGASAPTAAPALTWSSAPATLPYRDGRPVPTGYEIEETHDRTPVIIGAVLLGATWAAGLGIAAADGFAQKSGWLALPIAGPWLALGGREDPCEGIDAKNMVDTKINSKIGKCVAEPMVRGFLVFDGVMQATGTLLMLFGGSTEKRLIRSDLAGSSPSDEATVRVAPVAVGRSGYGVGAFGRF